MQKIPENLEKSENPKVAGDLYPKASMINNMTVVSIRTDANGSAYEQSHVRRVGDFLSLGMGMLIYQPLSL